MQVFHIALPTVIVSCSPLQNRGFLYCPLFQSSFPFFHLSAQYFLAILLLLALSTVVTVIILNFHHRGDLGETVPKWMEIVILGYMAKLVGMSSIVEYNKKKHTKNLGLVSSNSPLQTSVEPKYKRITVSQVKLGIKCSQRYYITLLTPYFI